MYYFKYYSPKISIMESQKIYASYVLQTEMKHQFANALISVPAQKYTYSLDNTANDVLLWAEKMQKEMAEGTKINVVGFFKIN
jgi:hypothetical protein